MLDRKSKFLRVFSSFGLPNSNHPLTLLFHIVENSLSWSLFEWKNSGDWQAETVHDKVKPFSAKIWRWQTQARCAWEIISSKQQRERGREGDGDMSQWSHRE